MSLHVFLFSSVLICLNLTYTFYFFFFFFWELFIFTIFAYNLYGPLYLYSSSLSISVEEIGQILIVSTLPILVYPLPAVHLIMPTSVMPSSHFSVLIISSWCQALPSESKVGLVLSCKCLLLLWATVDLYRPVSDVSLYNVVGAFLVLKASTWNLHDLISF